MGNIPATHVSWKIHFGTIPEGLFVLHTCDNRLCCNPDHLRIGTDLDNNMDMRAKGRARYGGKYHSPQGISPISDLGGVDESERD